ncbi:acyl-CoA thioesterase [Oceanobacter mangrovi]|uniref:acyl-CoA thioesterase n=1 Tax=Oceanobacter mangrovi TaxID=2862510 RepID=UPI001C8D50A7|nr:thioesterase family protein [Oceanobacter mangrovi]
MFINQRKLTIEWGDCDPAGIVFYPRYFAMFDASTMFLINAATGKTKPQLISEYDAVGWPMVDTRAQFFIPSRFTDEVVIESQATEIRRSSFDIRHRLLKGSKLAIECTETRVWVTRDPEDPAKIHSVPLPDTMVEALRATNPAF